MKKTLRKDIFRSVFSNKLRFISVVIIIALGFSFFVGIKSSAPQMRDNANEYFKNNNVADVRLTSVVGFSDGDIKAISSIEKVKYAVESMYVDAFLCSDSEPVLNNRGEKLTCRVGTVDFSKAEQFTVTQKSDDSYMNRLILFDGRYPENENECVIDANIADSFVQFKTGNTVSLKGDNSTLDDSLNVKEFKIVGTVKSPLYISDTYTDTSIGSGSLNTFIYVKDSAFNLHNANEVFVKMSGSDYYDKFSDKYNSEVSHLCVQINSFSADCFKNNKASVIPLLEQKINDKTEASQKYDVVSSQEIEDSENKLAVLKNIVNEKQKAVDEFDSKEHEQISLIDLDISKISTDLNIASDLLSTYTEQRDSIFNGIDGFTALKDEHDNLYKKHLEADKSLKAKKTELDKSKTELNKKNAEVTALEKSLNNSGNSVNDLKKQIQDIEKKLPELTSSKSTLENQKKHLQDEIFALTGTENSEASIQNAENELKKVNASILDINTQIEKLNAQKKILTQELDNNNSYKTDNSKKLTTAKEEAANAKTKFEKLNSEYSSLKKSYDDEQKKLNELSDKINKITAEKGDFTQINKNYDETSKKVSELKIELANAKNKKVITQKKHNEKSENILYDLSIVKIDYDNALKDFEKQKDDIKYNKSSLIGDLNYYTSLKDNYDDLSWKTVGLTKMQGFVSFLSAMENIRYTAYILPLIFFVIAMISCFVIMMKNIQDERQKIGIFKALGYSGFAIMQRYLLYSFFALLFGILIGFPLGTMVLPKTIYSIYKAVFTIPEIGSVYNKYYLVFGLIVCVVSVFTATALAVIKEIRNNPSDLMLPNSNGFKKRSFIEHIPGLWDKMSYGMVISARTVTRNRKRVFLGILGIMCCTALVLTSFGLLNSATDVTNKQFNKKGVFKYDFQITVERKNDGLFKSINSDDRIEKAVYVSKDAVSVAKDDIVANGVNIVVPFDSNVFSDYIEIGKKNLTDNDVIITRGAAEKLNIKPGDTICVIDSDCVRRDIKVTSVSENYINDYIYITKTSYKNIFNIEPDFTYILCKAKDYVKSEDIDAFATEYSENEFVTSSSTASNLETAEKISVDRVSVLLTLCIVFTALFTVILIYTISNLSLAQRIREVANIKVIGFSDHESLIYVMREMNISSIVGGLLGIVFGIILHRVFIGFIQVDNIVYNGYIQWWSYIATVGIVVLASVISAIPVRIKIKNINMAETLKETE